MPTSFLHLPDWRVTHVADHNTAYEVEARYGPEPESCPKCGVVGEFVRHGTLTQRVNDTAHSGQPVVIAWERQRYRCRACGGTFLQPSEDVDESRLMTKRLVRYIEREVLRRTFVSVADEVGVSEATIRNVFRAYAERVEAAHRFVAPELLGIDELHIRGVARCILTDLKGRNVVDFLETRTKTAVYHALLRLEDRERVEVVAIDMYRPYQTAAKAALPQAVVVVDKFHVVRMATAALDGFRRLIGKEMSVRRRRFVLQRRAVLLKRPAELTDEQRLLLEEWLTEFPHLRTAYDLKERFFGVWDAETVAEGRRRLHHWRAAVPLALEPVFRELLTAAKNWEPEILNYFATGRVTNAYTESVNRSLRDIDRAGRGYSFDALRIKALFAHDKQTRPMRNRRLAQTCNADATTPGASRGSRMEATEVQ